MSATVLTLDADAPPAAAGAAVQAVAAHLGLSAERTTRLRALVEQLVLESLEREGVEGDLDVVVRTSHGPGRLQVHVTDRRLPLAPATSRHAASRRMAAMGFADRLRIGGDGDQGNRATCDIEIDEPPSVAVEASDPQPPRATDAEAAALSIRPMEPADALALERCVYRCYGYSYLDPVLYRPRQMRRALRAATIRSFVAVTPDGDVVGHCALTFDHADDPVPEAGKLVVDPRYRGHHLAERLAAERLAWAREAGIAGYWSECVTNHAFSQKEVIGTGGVETGLLIGAVPASLSMQGLANHEGRHTLLPMYVPVADPGEQVLHVPERHAAVLSAMVAASGLDRDVVVDPDPPAAVVGRPRSQIHVDVAVPAGTAHLRVHEIGDDLVDRVADELEGLLAFDLGAVHLDLPLRDPAAAGAAVALERLGFCWGAWVPCFGPGTSDVLRLQRTGDHAADVDQVVCARPEGEAVRDHVIAEWHRVHHARPPSR